MSESAFRDGISAVEFAQGGGWIRHAQSRSAYPTMFEAPDVPGGLDRVGVVCLAITVLGGRGPEPSRLGLRTTPGRPLVSLGFGALIVPVDRRRPAQGWPRGLA
jgi:hypothetical protein